MHGDEQAALEIFGRSGPTKTMSMTEEEFIKERTVRDAAKYDVQYDSVNHPKHYKQHPSGVECIQITEHFNFNIGNAIKYLWRSDHKNGLEDLKKAQWYVTREIERLEKKEDDAVHL